MQDLNFVKLETAVRLAAQQRKAENKEFLENNLKALVEDGGFEGTVLDESAVDSADGFYRFDQDSYRHTRFDDLFIGLENAPNEDAFFTVTGIRFAYCDFVGCGFGNLKFIDCCFVGCNFTGSYTLGLGAVFENCRFMRTISGKNSLDDMPSVFTDCELTVKLYNCDFDSVVAEKTHFYFTVFNQVNAINTLFVDCTLDTVTVSDCDLRGTKLVKPRFIEFNVEDTIKRTKVNKKTFLGYIDYNLSEEREVRNATEVYSAFSEMYENNKVFSLAGEYFYLSKRTEFHTLKGWERFKSLVGLITCGYGERPSNSLITSLCLILLCGTLYLFFGVVANNELIQYRPDWLHPLPSFGQLIQCYHFSLVTFSTVGYGNVTPVGGSLAVSAFEMVLGVIMVGIWVSTLVRKMVR